MVLTRQILAKSYDQQRIRLPHNNNYANSDRLAKAICQVPDIVRTAWGLRANGVSFVVYDVFGQDELGIWSPGGSTKLAWFKDPGGNLLSLSQF